MKTRENYVPFAATHPGVLLKDELEANEKTQKDLAIETGLSKTVINEIISGKRSVTAEIAILLEEALGVPADYWMRFQSQYELDLARIKEKSVKRIANMKLWEIIKQYVPINYFRKQKYFVDDLEADIKKVREVYDVQDIDELVNLSATQEVAFFRKSDKLQIEENNILAWSSVAKYEAKQQQVNTYHIENIPTLLSELNTIFATNKGTKETVAKKLNQYGIKFIILEKIEKAPIDGLTFWSGDNPAIAMTLRHKRIDYFAFTIMHEIGHIQLHLKSKTDECFFDIEGMDEGRLVEKEHEADSFAQDALIPTKAWMELNSLAVIEDYSIVKIAKEYNIHPAILHGRVCFEKNNYKIRTTIDKTLN